MNQKNNDLLLQWDLNGPHSKTPRDIDIPKAAMSGGHVRGYRLPSLNVQLAVHPFLPLQW